MATKKRERAHRRKDWEFSPFDAAALRSFFLDTDGAEGWLGREDWEGIPVVSPETSPFDNKRAGLVWICRGQDQRNWWAEPATMATVPVELLVAP